MTRSAAIARLPRQCTEQDRQLSAARQQANEVAAQNDRLEAEIARLTDENATLRARG